LLFSQIIPPLFFFEEKEKIFWRDEKIGRDLKHIANNGKVPLKNERVSSGSPMFSRKPL
jgi:hypothetical protein